jgi:hyperosmotically inducible protein
MRILITVAGLVLLSGCTAMIVGGASGGDQQSGTENRGAGAVVADSGITAMIKGKLSADASVSVFEIGVKTRKGVVTLTGPVGSYAAREKAGKIAKGIDGVVAVNNLIVVEDRSDPK